MFSLEKKNQLTLPAFPLENQVTVELSKITSIKMWMFFPPGLSTRCPGPPPGNSAPPSSWA